MHGRIVTLVFALGLFGAACATETAELNRVGAAEPLAVVEPLLSFDRQVSVVIQDYAFQPASFTAAAGETVRFVLSNQGAFEHEFRISDRASVEAHVESGHEGHHEGGEAEGAAHGEMLVLVGPGEITAVEVEFATDTHWDMISCLIPGHYEAGMSADLTVSGVLAAAGGHDHGEDDHGDDDHGDDAAHDDTDGHHDDAAAEEHDEHMDGEAGHDDAAEHEDGAEHDDAAAEEHDDADGHHDDAAAEQHEDGAEVPEGHDNSDGHHDDDAAADEHDDGAEVPEGHDNSDGHHDP